MLEGQGSLGEFRLLLEELCCDLCRFEHVVSDGLAPEAVRIDREYWLGSPGAFADIRVAPSGRPSYFVEVKYGYTNEKLIHHLGQQVCRTRERERRSGEENRRGRRPGAARGLGRGRT